MLPISHISIIFLRNEVLSSSNMQIVCVSGWRFGTHSSLPCLYAQASTSTWGRCKLHGLIIIFQSSNRVVNVMNDYLSHQCIFQNTGMFFIAKAFLRKIQWCVSILWRDKMCTIYQIAKDMCLKHPLSKIQNANKELLSYI